MRLDPLAPALMCPCCADALAGDRGGCDCPPGRHDPGRYVPRGWRLDPAAAPVASSGGQTWCPGCRTWSYVGALMRLAGPAPTA